jgi:hypothetical protein
VLLRKCISVHSIRISRFPTYDENYLHGDLALLQFDVSIFTQKVLNTSNKNLFALQKGLPFKGIQIIYGLFSQFPIEKSLNEKLRHIRTSAFAVFYRDNITILRAVIQFFRPEKCSFRETITFNLIPEIFVFHVKCGATKK